MFAFDGVRAIVESGSSTRHVGTHCPQGKGNTWIFDLTFSMLPTPSLSFNFPVLHCYNGGVEGLSLLVAFCYLEIPTLRAREAGLLEFHSSNLGFLFNLLA